MQFRENFLLNKFIKTLIILALYDMYYLHYFLYNFFPFLAHFQCNVVRDFETYKLLKNTRENDTIASHLDLLI